MQRQKGKSRVAVIPSDKKTIELDGMSRPKLIKLAQEIANHMLNLSRTKNVVDKAIVDTAKDQWEPVHKYELKVLLTIHEYRYDTKKAVRVTDSIGFNRCPDKVVARCTTDRAGRVHFIQPSGDKFSRFYSGSSRYRYGHNRPGGNFHFAGEPFIYMHKEDLVKLRPEMEPILFPDGR